MELKGIVVFSSGFTAVLTAAIGGCRQKAAAEEMIVQIPATSIANVAVAKLPFHIYYVDPSDRSVWVARLDGTDRKLIVQPKIPKERVGLTVANFQQGNLIQNYLSPSGTLNVTLAIGPPLQLVVDQAPTVLPEIEKLQMEHLSIPVYSQTVGRAMLPPTRPLSRGGVPEARVPTFTIASARPLEKPKQFLSPWTFKFEISPASQNNRYPAHVSAIRMKHKDGRERTYQVRTHPMGRTELLGIFESRYLLLYDEPYVVLWDLVTDSNTRLLAAHDAVLWPFNKSRPLGTVEARAFMEVQYAWTLKTPDDVLPKPEYRVIDTESSKYRS